MLFNSYEFIFLFLPPALFGWWALRHRMFPRLVWLFIASLVFYAYWDWRFVGVMLFSTVMDYCIGLGISRAPDTKAKRRWMTGSVICNLGLLGFFKYAGFFLSSVRATAHGLGLDWAVPTLEIVLPAGISFYTFGSMSYTIDLYKGLVSPAKSFLHFAVYVSLFPHLIAGPIVRYSYIEEQLRDLKVRLTRDEIWRGAVFFVWGLAEKVIVADSVAKYSDSLLATHPVLGFFSSWAAILGYTYQILFDFSGYSCMAVGLAMMLGFRLPQNFNSPYKAENPSDFWQRWHITLSQWLRDYLYFSLGGSRHGLAKTVRNLVITMFLGGLWHGAAWTFVAWGLYHGLLLGSYHTLKFANLWPKAPAIGRAVTFLAVVIGWVLFRSTNWPMAGSLLSAMFGLRGLAWSPVPRSYLLMLLCCFLWTNFGPNAFDVHMKARPWTALLLAAVAMAVFLLLREPSPFLYFQF